MGKSTWGNRHGEIDTGTYGHGELRCLTKTRVNHEAHVLRRTSSPYPLDQILLVTGMRTVEGASQLSSLSSWP
jgi:hypothetical protein